MTQAAGMGNPRLKHDDQHLMSSSLFLSLSLGVSSTCEGGIYKYAVLLN